MIDINAILRDYHSQLMPRRIEIDIDGVIADLLNNPELKRRLRHVLPNYTEEMLKDYYFHHLKDENPEAFKIIRAAFADAEYFRHLPMYDGVMEGFYRLLSLEDVELHIHTLITGDDDVVQARKEWLEKIDCIDQMHYHIDHYTKTMFNDSYIVIEDSPENLEHSNAKHKILIHHRYNDEYAKANPNVHVAKDFNHATQIALSLLA